MLHFQYTFILTKASHMEATDFYSAVDGKISHWDSGWIHRLLEMVNELTAEDRFTKDDGPVPYSPMEYDLCHVLRYWFEQIIANGVTEELVGALNGEQMVTRYQHILVLEEDGSVTWRYVADFGTGRAPETRASYIVSHLLECGALDSLKRCHSEDCENLFAGRPNTKWCSKACGSRQRMRSKRRRDR